MSGRRIQPSYPYLRHILLFVTGLLILGLSYCLNPCLHDIFLGLGTGVITSTIVACAADISAQKKMLVDRTFCFASLFGTCKECIGNYLWISRKYEDNIEFRKSLDSLDVKDTLNFCLEHSTLDILETIPCSKAVEELSKKDTLLIANNESLFKTIAILKNNIDSLLEGIENISNNALYLVQNGMITAEKMKTLEEYAKNINILRISKQFTLQLLIQDIASVFSTVSELGQFDDTLNIEFNMRMSISDFNQFILDAIDGSY